jgi:hypothetical protein
MTEERPEYEAAAIVAELETLDGSVMLITESAENPGVYGLPRVLELYYSQRRDALITELRAIDRLLGRRQTIPVRRR